MFKKPTISAPVLLFIALFTNQAFAVFSTEDFEGEPRLATSFTDNGQTFDVSSVTGEGYNVFLHDTHGSDTCVDCGWNGAAIDQQFLDNSGGGDNGDGNGSSFTIKTDGSERFFVRDLYLFCSTLLTGAHSGTVTITGMRNDMLIYTITKSTGFSSPVTLSPNNGYTLFDFVAAGFSGDPIDELIFTSTGNLDYMSLDAFTWEFTALPVELQSFSID